MSQFRLVLAGAILILLGFGAALWLNWDQGGSPPTALPEQMAEQSSSALRGVLSAADATSGADAMGAGLRIALREGDGLDPEVRNALSGFRGRIVDYRENPVDSCGVRIYRFAMDSVIRPNVSPMGLTMEPSFVAGETRTDLDGRFLITGIWPRGIFLLLGGIDTDNPTRRIVQQTPGPGEIVDLGDIQLNNGAVLTGTVVDPEGQPVEGALVRAVDLPGQFAGMVPQFLGLMPIERFDPEGAVLIREAESPVQVVAMPPWVSRVWEHLPIPTTHTDPDGWFRLVGLAPAPNLLAVTMRGYLSEVRPRIVLKGGEERDLGRIRLREGEQVIGHVLDSEGEPVAGAEVVAAPTTTVAPIDLGSFVGPTDEEGRFEAEGFPRGRVTVAARRGPGHAWVLADPQSIDQDVLLTLPATYSLTVSVIGAAGEAVESPEFRLVEGSGDEGIMEMATLGFLQRVDIDDRMERLEDGRHRIGDLSEGNYTLLATSPGYAMASVQVNLLGNQEVGLELSAEVLYRVQVVNSLGKPIRQAEVYAQERGRGANMEMPLHVGRTRADGRLSITQISTERIRLTAKHPAYGMVHAEGALADGEILIAMRTPGRIEGLLTEKGGLPTPGKWTVIAMETGRGQRRGQRGALEEVPRFAVPDLQGDFRFPGLQPGSFRLQVISSLDMLTSPSSLFAYAMEAQFQGDVGDTVDVIEGLVTRVEIETNKPDIVDGPAARITGSVMVDGQPAVGMRVMLMGENTRKSAELDEAGRFDLGYVPAGNARLSIIDPSRGDMFTGRNGQLWSESLEVVANQDLEKTIDIETSSLSGVITGPDGFTARNAMVQIAGRIGGDSGENRGSRVSFNSQSDSQGRFEFERIPAAEYTVEAFTIGERRARGSVSRVEVLAGIPTMGVQVSLIGMVTVSGRVDLSIFGEQKPDWMFIEFVPDSPEGESRSPQRTSGSSVARGEGEFKIEDLLPGSYKVRVHLNRGSNYQHQGTVVVGNVDVTGLVIRPVPVEDKRNEGGGRQ